jgi:hypothetical protein
MFLGAGEVDQVVEYLSSKHEALSSTPRTTKNKNSKIHMDLTFSDFLICLYKRISHIT